VNRFPWYEDLTEGKPVRIITDGIIHTGEIGRHTLTQDEIFLLLRNQGVRSLVEVETAYLERDGSLSVFKLPADKQKPGLPTISEDIIEEWKSFKGGMQADKSGFYSCLRQVKLSGWKKEINYQNVEETNGYIRKR
jgi:hypothetical protein